MGEAWFMGEVREMYPELFGDLDQLTDEQIYKPMEELASGISSFGQLEEWIEWYHYLLPRLLERRWTPYFHDAVELLNTAFFELYPATVDNAAYEELSADALLTMGQYIMAPKFWPDGDPDHKKCLHKYQCVDGSYGWGDASGLLSSSLFFCLKYLPVEAVGYWFESAFAIDEPHWKQQILVWLVGAHPLLAGQINQPSEFPERGRYRIAWDWSHLLDGDYAGDHEPSALRAPFLAGEKRDVIIALAKEFDVSDFFEELMTNPALSQLASESSDLQDRFVELYR